MALRPSLILFLVQKQFCPLGFSGCSVKCCYGFTGQLYSLSLANPRSQSSSIYIIPQLYQLLPPEPAVDLSSSPWKNLPFLVLGLSVVLKKMPQVASSKAAI